MEASILKALIETAISNGFVAESTLLLLVIALGYVLYRFVLKPMYEKVKEIPEIEDIEESVININSIGDSNLEYIKEKIDNISERLGEVQDTSRGNSREIQEMKQDIETVKRILNQFQGHMMYSRNVSDFGNQELK